MGNRAVIATERKDLGVYLHWNGGLDSVTGFLAYCEIKEYSSPDRDCYGWARLCQVIGNYLGDNDSLGVGRYEELDTDNWDNGVYIVKDWKIVGREFNPEEEQQGYKLPDMLEGINQAQPIGEQLTDEQIQSYLIGKRLEAISNSEE